MGGTTNILGFNLSHDSSVCLMQDGKVTNAVALERTTRVKRGTVSAHTYSRAMSNLVYHILSCQNLKLNDINYWVACSTEAENQEQEGTLLYDLSLMVPREKILSIPHPSHHLCHASASFFSSQYEEAAALVIDAYGSKIGTKREAESGFLFNNTQVPELIFRTERPVARIAGIKLNNRIPITDDLFGIGEIYRIITICLGFVEKNSYYDDAGKTMGLAAYGKRLSENPMFIEQDSGSLSYKNAFSALIDLNFIEQENGHYFLKPRTKDTPISNGHENLAAQIQWEFEEACLFLIDKLVAETGCRSLVVGGGCFLNSVLNHRILKERHVDNLYIFPAATDDGNAVGAASYAHFVLLGQSPKTLNKKTLKTTIKNFYLGKCYSESETLEAVEEYGLSYEILEDEFKAADIGASLLSEGKIIGWYQKNAEFGPRALGHRSILSTPLGETTKEHLNNRVKFRENFRPFAASVLIECASDFFELAAPDSPYMLYVCKVKDSVKGLIPAVTHVDNTCRVQTVTQTDTPEFYRLIRRFGELTGIPLILNTYFNLRGMPIVDTPKDAIACFTATQMDDLIVGRVHISAPNYPSMVPTNNKLNLQIQAQWESGAQWADVKYSNILTFSQIELKAEIKA